METKHPTNAIKYFIYEASSHTEITINDAVEISLEDAVKRFFKLIPEKGNYIGFVINNSQVMQFMSVGIANSYLLDIPVTSKKGSLQKMVDSEECYTAICSLFENNGGYEIKDMKFKKW